MAREIAAALTDPPSCWVPPGAQQQLIRVANSTLGGGRAGIALFFGYLAHSDQESASYASLARDFVGETVRAASTELMGPSLFGGFAGIGWTLARLHDWGVVACDEATFEPIDEALLSFVDRQPWPWQIDLISGVTGIAVYALDRLPRPSAVRTLELIVDTLESSAEKNDQGITWFTPPHLLQPESLREAPHGY
ncbi:MAG: lanthionine synthetase LanC family protein, partial [Solimonas sp.]